MLRRLSLPRLADLIEPPRELPLRLVGLVEASAVDPLRQELL
jgi:hypothetical protein